MRFRRRSEEKTASGGQEEPPEPAQEEPQQPGTSWLTQLAASATARRVGWCFTGGFIETLKNF